MGVKRPGSTGPLYTTFQVLPTPVVCGVRFTGGRQQTAHMTLPSLVDIFIICSAFEINTGKRFYLLYARVGTLVRTALLPRRRISFAMAGLAFVFDFALLPPRARDALAEQLPGWDDRKALRACCRALRRVVNAWVKAATLDMWHVGFIPHSELDSSSARLLQGLQRLVLHDNGELGGPLNVDFAHRMLWRFGLLHLASLSQLQRLEITRKDAYDDQVFGAERLVPLLQLAACAPASLCELDFSVGDSDSEYLRTLDTLPIFAALARGCTALQELALLRLPADSLAAFLRFSWPQLRSLRLSVGSGADAALLLSLGRPSQLSSLALRSALHSACPPGCWRSPSSRSCSLWSSTAWRCRRRGPAGRTGCATCWALSPPSRARSCCAATATPPSACRPARSRSSAASPACASCT